MNMTRQSRFGVDYTDPVARLSRDQEGNAFDLVIALRDERERQGLTQREVAQRMGRHQSVVSNIERLGSDPRWSSLRRYATALGVEISYETTCPSSLRGFLDRGASATAPGADDLSNAVRRSLA